MLESIKGGTSTEPNIVNSTCKDLTQNGVGIPLDFCVEAHDRGNSKDHGVVECYSKRDPSHLESDHLNEFDKEIKRSCFCWGHYEAPEGRPWVFMHVVVGVCIIHFSVAISQAILYTAAVVADSNQRMPQLFNIRAGNTQIAVNIIVSIINLGLLPTIGAISDYTRYRYHVGCISLLMVCATEFVSFTASKEVAPAPICPVSCQ
jgi:hypothetical protein